MSNWYDWNKGTQCGACGRSHDNCTCGNGWVGLIQWAVIFAVLIAVVSIIR